MNNIRTDFIVWKKDISELPPGYQNITCHTIFNVNVGENFRRKARLFSEGQKTKTPAAIPYSSVVSRYLVCIVIPIAALNDLDVLSSDI